ncbi:hypothetical protein [Hymenobacter ruricola]|uniref:Uncharacterized protein n=1 Tax=Hymenobacter ruricola TaxID=2791023 RepID=A0ABS0I487_9BACT|nr:hypothetical protein [Hymenobacter ruricola]MBF9221784.1 hypothetical protein [Hymenobacter ruricola]
MKTKLLWLLATCLLGAAPKTPLLAQAMEDHLLPSQGYFASYAHERPYYPKVQEALCAGLSDTPLARVVVLPSFSPEYALSLEEKAHKYYLTYRVCLTSAWGALQRKETKPVAVSTVTVELGAPAAVAVASAFNKAILQTKYPAPTEGFSVRLDGTTYAFITFQRGVGLQSGETWSPVAGTKMGKLVAIVETLKKVTITPADQPLQAELLQQARQLLATLEAE